MAFNVRSVSRAADKAPTVYPTAVLPFSERGREAKEFGSKVTDLAFANLVANPDLFLVDRKDMKKIFDELELNVSGAVNPNEATQVGQLIGAKLIVTGSALNVGNPLYLVAKIIGTETSRVVGASVKGRLDDELDTPAETELTVYCKETGFGVVDPKQGNPKDADVYVESGC